MVLQLSVLLQLAQYVENNMGVIVVVREAANILNVASTVRVIEDWLQAVIMLMCVGRTLVQMPPLPPVTATSSPSTTVTPAAPPVEGPVSPGARRAVEPRSLPSVDPTSVWFD